MPRPRNCRLCGEPLKNKRPDSIYCNTYCKLIASKIRRNIISLPYALKLIDSYKNKGTKIQQ
jgi:hypothetical protein